MIDKALGFGPVQLEGYYFQLIPLFLSIVGKESLLPADDTSYRFSIWKGQQKFDENKFAIKANFQIIEEIPVLAVSTCKLNFYIPNYNRYRKQQFTLKLIQNENKQDYEVGQYVIDVSKLIEMLKNQKKVRHQLKTFFSQDYELDFEIYIEKSRANLQKIVKDFQPERSNKSFVKVTSEAQISEQQPIPHQEIKNENPISLRRVSNAASAIQKSITINDQQSEQMKRLTINDTNEEVKSTSESRVPVIETKFKQLAKSDAKSQIRMKQSEKLSETEYRLENQHLPYNQSKQRVFLWIFLLVGIVFMYFAMHPNKKV